MPVEHCVVLTKAIGVCPLEAICVHYWSAVLFELRPVEPIFFIILMCNSVSAVDIERR